MAADSSNNFRLIIVTPDAEVFDEPVRSVILPAHDGQYGVLKDHAPFLIQIGAGSLNIQPTDGTAQNLYVEGGVAQMKDNKLTVLTDDALTLDKIDRAAASADLESALAVEAVGDSEQKRKEQRLTRARAKLALAGA